MAANIIVGKYTLESLTTGMYSNPRDIYREYIQNSVDSIDSAIKSGIIQSQSARINISIDRENRSIIIEDNGSGLSYNVAPETLTSIGNSNKSISNNRGFRGIGRLSGLSYCRHLIFETSFVGEPIKTVVSFDAKNLKRLLVPGEYPGHDMVSVISEITNISTETETDKRHYFKVIMEDVDDIEGLLDFDSIVHFLSQTAPVMFNTKNFSWSRKIHKAIKKYQESTEEYVINILNNDEEVQLFKPYSDRFVADKFKRITDELNGIEIVEIYDDHNKEILAVVWYSVSNFYGSILDERKKGLRFRKGNILVGDSTSLNGIFKENRFNGWFQGEVIILSPKIIPNTRRDGFEKNREYLFLINELEKLGAELSRKIRAASSARSIQNKVPHNQAKTKNNLNNFDFNMTDVADESEEIEIELKNINFESDPNLKLFKDLNDLLNTDNRITKYSIINFKNHLSVEQKKFLEKVFDAISEISDKDHSSIYFKAILDKFH